MFKNKVTTDLIEHYLERFGWSKHQTMSELESQGLVVTGWRSGPADEGFMMSIDPITERSVLIFQVWGVLTVDPDTCSAGQMQELFRTLLVENKTLLVGAFAFDPDSNSVLFRHTMPIASDDLAYEDFEHVMRGLTAVVETAAPKLRSIVATEAPAEGPLAI